MPALDGAIEDINIDDDGAFPSRRHRSGTPQGICGSGLIDLLSELLRTGRMNELGRFERRRIAHHPRRRRTTSTSSKATSTNWLRPRAPTSRDCKRSFSNYGVDFDDIDVFYLAGGFGRHFNVEAARRIGLIPNLPDSKIVQVGNAAIEGAAIALLSESKRAELEQLVKNVEHCRLETHPRFFDFFVEGCQFKPVETSNPGVGMNAMIELLDAFPDINVQPAEYKRLLGYPRRCRPRRPRPRTRRLGAPLVCQQRPALGLRPRNANALRITNGSITIDGVSFTSKRLQKTLLDAAGAQRHSRRRQRRPGT